MELSETYFSQKDIEKFWRSVGTRGPNDCWLWLGSKTHAGYGSIYLTGEAMLAHRMSWMLANRQEIPDDLFIRHTCDTRDCVNPRHLLIGTHADNMQDMAERGRARRGVRNHLAILTEGDVLEIRRMCAGYKPRKGMAHVISKAAVQFNVSESAVRDIMRGRNWGWLTE